MRLWADVLDSQYRKIGAGPIAVTSIQFDKVLDGAGSWSARLIATDSRNLQLVTVERYLRFNVQMNDESVQEVGVGIIQERTIREDAGQTSLEVKGVDTLQELARKTVLLRRTYDEDSASSVFSSLANLGGWAVSGTAETTVTVKLDGISVLKALVKLAEETGLHFRFAGQRALEVGAFGELSEARAVQVALNSPALTQNPRILPIVSITVQEQTADVVNWILPLGSGTGTDILDIGGATGAGYAIQSVTLPDASTGYYIADSTSIAKYGQIERVMKWDIEPISTAPADVTKAKNQLYAAAVNYLRRNKDKQTVYTVTVKRSYASVDVGQRLRVTYRGVAQKIGGELAYIDVDDEFYVLQIKESYSDSGDTLQLTLSNVDIMPADGVSKMVNTLETIEITRLTGF